MKRLPALGVILLVSLSIGSEDECCQQKTVGDHLYHYVGWDDTSQYNCHSNCVYSKDGKPSERFCFKSGNEKSVCKDDSDGVKLYHQFYSGLSSLHGYLKSQLTPEQSAMVTHPEGCLKCPKPKYCWHGQCVGEDTRKLPSGDHSAYIDSITQMTKYQSSFRQSACSDVRIECYGVCLGKILNAAAQCITNNIFDPSQIIPCVEGILDAASDCIPCICQIFKKHFPWCPCSEGKPTVPGNQCDRPCSPYSPRKCVFNFTLEMLKTNTDGRRADGRLRSVLAYNGQIPGPPIVICEGDELVVNFKNNITGNMANMDGSSNVTTLHFHGIRGKSRPWSDGVPFVTQCPIIPTNDFHYGFNASDMDGAPPGTYWYHSHVGAQRTNGAYGALIIKEKVKDDDDVIDDASNTLVLQEWYISSTHQIPVSILINGRGRLGPEIYTGGDEEITNHLKGKGASFTLVENKDFNAEHFTTNYTEFDVQPGKSYRFRVIGAISQNFPLRLSIDDHKFTAIAMDSLNIKQVPDLTDLWLAAGERYDIVVKTKTAQTGEAYKIRVFGYTDQSNHAAGSLCTIAWLKYPNQYINYTFVTDSACSGFDLPSPLRTLNPVPNNYAAWEKRIQYPHWNNTSNTGDIFIADLRAIDPVPTIDLAGLANLNTHYIEFVGNITFNNLRMTYPPVPFLLQDPADETDRCGSECTTQKFLDLIPYTNCTTKTPAYCTAGEYCECQNVLKEPWAQGYWAEIVLVNNNEGAASHPIHQHGGWYWVVGERKYNNSISRDFIMEQDKNCTAKKNCLPRNFDWPPAKDTIQVPSHGYVIVRTKLDNAGTWIFHCHINYHVTIGMAMVLQIGELGKSNLKQQDWCTGPLDRNVECENPPPPPGGGPTEIYWHLYMENAERCVTPGTIVTFSWVKKDHNVNQITPTQYETCQGFTNTTAHHGDYIWTAPETPETYYFACGMKDEHHYHCNHGMKAKIHVHSICP